MLINLVHAVNSAYRSNGTWLMNSRTLSYVRKLKDNQNQYLWVPGLQAGTPDRLLGYPISVWEDMDNISTGSTSFPVAFGDVRRSYVLAERVGLRVTLNDNVTAPGYVKFFFRKRVGGHPYNVNSLKWIKTTL